MASNANPLHPPLEAEQYSEYTSIGCALVVPPGTFLIPHRRWLPQPAYTPPSKWKVSTGSPNKQLPSISFDYVDRPNQGVPMRELSARNMNTLVRMLQGANEPVFSQTGLRKITLRIHVSHCHFILDAAWTSVTHLVRIVARIPSRRLGEDYRARFKRPYYSRSTRYHHCDELWSVHGGTSSARGFFMAEF